MSMDLDRFCFKLFWAKFTAVVLSTWMGVGGCTWPRNLRACRNGMASFALSKVAAISVSAAEAMIFLTMAQRTCTAPLGLAYSGLGHSSDKKKKPPALLLALDTERHDPSLCACSIMPLRLKRTFALG